MATTKKKPTAKQIAARKLFAQRAKSGAFRRKANPTKRPKPKGVKRPSQTTGRAPTKRLVARRRKTAHAPKGFFANPAQEPAAYAVHKAGRDGHAAELIARFAKKVDAVAYGRAYVKARRVPVVIVGKAR